MGSGFRSWTAGEVATASNVQNYLQDQVVMVFASSSARNSAVTAPEEGMVCFLTDSDTFTVYDGADWVTFGDAGAWFTFTPTWTASSNPSIGNGTLLGRYVKLGRLITVTIEMTAGTTTTFGSGAWNFDLPADATTAPEQFLPGRIYDASANTAYGLVQGVLSNGTTAVVQASATGGGVVSVTATAPFTWGNGDKLLLCGSYQSTS